MNFMPRRGGRKSQYVGVSNKEAAFITDAFHRGICDKEIVSLLGNMGYKRTHLGIKNWRQRMGLLRPRSYGPPESGELAIIQAGFAAQKTDKFIARELQAAGFQRTHRGVRDARKRLGLSRGRRPSESRNGTAIGFCRFDEQIDYVGRDMAFCAAMRAAPECPPEGIVRESTMTRPPIRLYPGSVKSLCGSPSAMCAAHAYKSEEWK